MKHFWRKPGKTLIYVLSLFMTIGLLGIPVYAQGTENVENPTGNQPVTNTTDNEGTNDSTNDQNQGTDTTGGNGSQTETNTNGSEGTGGSITVKLPANPPAGLSDNTDNLQIDVYQIATGQKDPNYSSYNFTFTDAFKVDGFDLNGIDLENVDEWKTLANQLAEKVKEGTGSPVQVTLNQKLSVQYGIYLILAHDKRITDKNEYFAVMSEDAGAVTGTAGTSEDTSETSGTESDTEQETTQNTETLCTILKTNANVYYFKPVLVAVPSTRADANLTPDEPMKTWEGTWQNDINVYLKPEGFPLYGSLVINKVVQELNDRSIGNNPITPVTAVFRITGWKSSEKKADEKVYSNVASITIPTGSPVTVDHIPVGTYVEVTEEYTGAGYTRVFAEGEKEILTAVIPGPDESPAEATFTFKDTYDDELKKGYGIMNTFTKTEPANWSWKNDAGQGSASTAPASSETAEGGTQE